MLAGLGVDTPILMHDYTIKKIQDIQPGDKVLNENKKPVVVHSITEIYDETCSIVPNDKGEQYNLCYHGKLVLRNKINNTIEVKQIKQLINDSDISFGLDINNYKLIRVSLNFDEKETEIDPYFYGLFLADNKSTQSLTDNKWEDIKKIYKYSYSMKYKEEFSNSLIPDEYIFNDYNKRLHLLAGIIDSCGLFESDSHCFEMRIKDEKIAKQIVFLARSIGLGSGKRDIFYYNGNKIIKTFKIYIYGDIKMIPTRFLTIKTDSIKNYSEIEFTIYPNNMNRFFRLELENGNRLISGGLDILSF